MNSPNNLEINGSLQTNPLAELLYEIAEHRFNGSLRIAHDAHKIVVYFDAGDVVFAVSNARQHRLFEALLRNEILSKESILAIADFTNDLSLRENLLKDNLMEKREVDRLFSELIYDILKTAIDWRSGEWTFSPFIRIKGNIRFTVNTRDLLIESARNLPPIEAARKFGNPHESLSVKSAMPAGVNLSPHESFVFSRFQGAPLTVEEVQNLSGLPEIDTFQILYALWLGGFVVRQDRNAAFTEKEVSAIQSAKLTVKKDESKPIAQMPIIAPPVAAAENTETATNTSDATEASADESSTLR